MKTLFLFVAGTIFFLATTAFCGFYVAKVDAKLFNNTSEVILVRKADKTVLTMKNDYEGDLKDFAMIVPVPEVIKREQIRIADAAIFEKLNDYSGPRLVEYQDEHPCMKYLTYTWANSRSDAGVSETIYLKDENGLGVTILESYSIGEYDIVVLSATQSDGLATWLTANGYKIPEKASKLLQPYIRNEMKFFVVKVNLKEQAKVGGEQLRPIQIEFQSDKFVLPIRLGMANAKGTQDMLIYAFTAQGRVTSTNYRTVEIPSNQDIPEFIQEDFQPFYKDLFDKAYKKEGRDVVFTEYAWNLDADNFVKCDPCATTPPAYAELKEAGVFWLTESSNGNRWQGSDYQGSLHFTRLHVRYDGAHFPQDLSFQLTPDRRNFQGRYVIHHPVKEAVGMEDCEEAAKYFADVVMRRKRELINCEKLTGWDVSNRFLTYVGPYEILKKKYEKGQMPLPENPSGPILPYVILLIACGGLALGWLIPRIRLNYN